MDLRSNDYYFDSNSANYFSVSYSPISAIVETIFKQQITGTIDSKDALFTYSINNSETNIIGDWSVYHHILGRDSITDQYIMNVIVNESGDVSGNYIIKNQHNPPFFQDRIYPLTGKISPVKLGDQTVLDVDLNINLNGNIWGFAGYAIKSSSSSVNFTDRSMVVLLKQISGGNNLLTFTLKSQINN